MNYFFIFISLLFVIYVVNLVRKKTFSIIESFFWLCGAIVTLVFSVFPNIIKWMASLVGVEYPPSLLFILGIMFLLFMNFRCSRKIVQLQEKVIELAQNVAILKSEPKEKK